MKMPSEMIFIASCIFPDNRDVWIWLEDNLQSWSCIVWQYRCSNFTQKCILQPVVHFLTIDIPGFHKKISSQLPENALKTRKLFLSGIQASPLLENALLARKIIFKWNPDIFIVRKYTRQYGNYFQVQSRHLYCKKIHHQPLKLFSGAIQVFSLAQNIWPAIKIICKWSSDIFIVRKWRTNYRNYFQIQFRYFYDQKKQNKQWKLFASGIQIFALLENPSEIMEIKHLYCKPKKWFQNEIQSVHFGKTGM